MIKTKTIDPDEIMQVAMQFSCKMHDITFQTHPIVCLIILTC